MASTTIDSLNMKITADAQSALGAISKLKESILGLSKSVDGLSNTSGLTALQKLGQIKVNVTDSSATSFATLAKAVKTLEGVNLSGISKLTYSLSKLNDFKLTAANARNLVSVISGLQNLSDVKPLNPQVHKNMEELAVSMGKLQHLKGIDFSGIAKLNGIKGTTVNVDKSLLGLGSTFGSVKAKAAAFGVAMHGLGLNFGEMLKTSNEYVENLNLFTVAMGDAADGALQFAERVQNIMGIDMSQWIRNQGVFQTLLTGFGVVGDKAAVMSQQMTQLGYDLSSFFNIPFEDALQKLQSGLSGELEPLRRLGYDLSVARLQQEAYALGISESVSKMTQAEKSMLRYHAIMTQVTTAQGDMARTLSAPANQIRIFSSQVLLLKRALGNILIPAINAVLPYIIAFVKALRWAADAIANLVGFKLPEFDYSGINTGLGGAVDATEDIADNTGTAAKNAKKLRDYVMGIDELNIIAPPEADVATGGSGGGGVNAGTGGLDIPIETYDFMQGLSEKADKLVDKMKTLVKWIGAIGATWAALKFGKKVLNFFVPDKKGIQQLKALWDGIKSKAVTLKTTMQSKFPSWVSIGKGGLIIAATIVAGLAAKSTYEDVDKKLGGHGNEGYLLYLQDFQSALEKIHMPKAITGLFDELIEKVKKLGGLKGTLSWLGSNTMFGYTGGMMAASNNLRFDIETGDMEAAQADMQEFLKQLGKGNLLIKEIAEGFLYLKAPELFPEGYETGAVKVWEKIKGIFSSVGDFFVSLWDKITAPFITAWNTIKSVAISVWEAIWGVIEPIWNNIKILWDNAVIFFGWVWEKIKAPFITAFGKIKEVAKATWDGIKSVWDTVAGFFSNVWSKIKQPFIAVGEFFKGIFSTAWEKIKGVFSKVGDFFGNIWEIIKGKFVDIGTKIGEVVGGAFKKVINGILSAVETILNSPIRGINKLIGALQDVPGLGGLTMLNEISLPRWYANGGFPTAGELFFANESGNPEYVGSMGGRTAVANSDQIISGVASGVAQANQETNNILVRVASLLEQINQKDVSVNLDGRTLNNRLEKVRLEQGVSIVSMV